MKLIKGLLKHSLSKEAVEFLSDILHDSKSIFLAYFMPWRHARAVKKLRDKGQIRVVFLVLHSSVWKFETVYARMLEDSAFEPVILACPDYLHNQEHMKTEITKTIHYFSSKGYIVHSALKTDGSWLNLRDLNPDLVVFTNPHNITMPQYYAKAYFRYLSIYVPYFFMATVGPHKAAFGTPMLNAMWRIYWPHRFSYDAFNLLAKGDSKRRSRLTGYPSVEPLLGRDKENLRQAWIKQDNKVRIIYAPHHSISDDERHQSTFLRLGPVIRRLAEKHKNSVRWSFKPHPHLRPRLYSHPDWGKDRTDKYFEFWQKNDYTQLDEDNYIELFIQSDAIIHDSSSFIAEYAVTKKPALFLLSDSSKSLNFVNEFGSAALSSYYKAHSVAEIEAFVGVLLEPAQKVKPRNSSCFDDYLAEFYGTKLPSEKIMDDLKRGLGINRESSL